MLSKKCVVVGAGALGAALSVELAASGADVTVIDASRPGSGTTSATFAWVGASHPGLGLTPDYLELNIRGVAAHRRWSQLWGDRGWFTRSGCLTWHTAPEAQDEMVQNVRLLRDRGYPARLLSPSRVLERIEPSLQFAPSVEVVGWFPDEGYALGRPMVADMLGVAASLGAQVRMQEEVVGISRNGDRVSGVQLLGGESLAADIVVSAAGTRTPTILQLAGAVPVPMVDADVPRSLAVGLLAITTPVERVLTSVVVADELMMRPDGGGRIMLHRDAEDRGVELSTPTDPAPLAAHSLVEEAAKYLGGNTGAVLESVRIGIRPLASDHLPVLGWASGVQGLYLMLTHSGMTLAPALAELVAAEVTDDAEQQVFGALRPQRFE